MDDYMFNAHVNQTKVVSEATSYLEIYNYTVRTFALPLSFLPCHAFDYMMMVVLVVAQRFLHLSSDASFGRTLCFSFSHRFSFWPWPGECLFGNKSHDEN